MKAPRRPTPEVAIGACALDIAAEMFLANDRPILAALSAFAGGGLTMLALVLWFLPQQPGE